ncbi:hypothetical protein FHS16_000520 [Paenibacillus endophyticus]|uniref:Uncharacterized protein n=1 Tax=Paenibacillus endophyticus TaxID=1294268 RepID=A0A7W5G8P7_9BACL|nr:hypothetical protein [Paenibacillus endophyticus]
MHNGISYNDPLTLHSNSGTINLVVMDFVSVTFMILQW